MITSLVVNKADPADPRYPDPIEGRPFSAVYLLTCTLDDGSQQEASFAVMRDMTPAYAAAMLKTFAGAVERMSAEQKAA